MKRLFFQRRSAFSLVEITLALGIVAFVMVGVLGLFSVGLDASRRSAGDTVFPQVIHQVLSQVRTPDLPPPGDPPLTFYFNEKGESVTAADAIYNVTLSTQDPAASLPDTGSHLYLIRLEIVPVRGNVTGTVVHTSRLIP